MTAFDGGRGALQGAYALAGPRLPRLQGLQGKPRGEPVGVKRRWARLPCLAYPGLPAYTAGVRHVVSPRDAWQEGLLGPHPPARRQPCVLHILLNTCPPEVHQGRHGWPRLTHLGPGGVTGRALVTGGPCFPGLHLRVQPACDLGGCLHGGVVAVEGMSREREGLKVSPVRVRHCGPSRDCSAACLQRQGALPVVLAPCGMVLASREPLLGVRQLLRGLASLPAKRARITLHDIRDTGKEVGHTQALATRFGSWDSRVASITDEREDRRSQGLAPLVHQSFPCGRGAIRCHLCHKQGPAGQVHHNESHVLQEGFIHGANDFSDLACRRALLLPRLRRLHNRLLPRLQHPAQGGRRTAQVVLQAQTHEKLAQRVHAHAALEAEGLERGDSQTCEPLAPSLRFPPPGLWRVAPTSHRVPKTVHTALGEAGLLGQVAHALFPMVIKTCDNAKTSVPQSPVGLFSVG